MRNKLLVILIFSILLFPAISSTCTVTFDKSTYSPAESITATMICNEHPAETSKSYILNWTNSSGIQIELDTGITPKADGTIFFFGSYIIPSGYSGMIYANLSGNNLEGSDFANVTAATNNSLIIENVMVTTKKYIGKFIGVTFELYDDKNKKINRAQCTVYYEDGSGIPSGITGSEIKTYDGIGSCGRILDAASFQENTEYVVKIRCVCGMAGSESSCIDEDGTEVSNSFGSTLYPFRTDTWLRANTVTDKSIYEMKDEIFICANITNVNYSRRISLEIYNNLRCSKEKDNNNDLDRILIVSDESYPDLRGISVNTTQMQCKRFMIPESAYLEGRNSECYASTTVWVLDEDSNRVMSYSTTSPVLNITSNELNLFPDWEKIADYTFNSIINLSHSTYSNYNGTGTGNIDVKLNRETTSIHGENQQTIPSIKIEDFLNSRYIKNITVKDISGSLLSSGLEFLDDGSMEIEIRNVDLSSSGWYNVTVEFNQFEERSAVALEGIENKTGTFHLDVECPSEGTIGNDINCIITAYIEDSQIAEKEVDFTCYISDGASSYSSSNFNQMITKNAFSVTKGFRIPDSFRSSRQYILQCHADYYNLGSRRDSFYDSFTVISSSSPAGGGLPSKESPITGGTIDEGEEGTGKVTDWIEKFNPFSPEREIPLIIIAAALFVGIIAFILISLKRRNKYEGNFRRITSKIIIVVTIIIIILIIFYIYDNMKSIPLESAKIQDPLFRDMILITFIAIISVILFKMFNIHGEIRFGKYGEKKIKENEEVSRLQNKLNKEILKSEIQKEKKDRKQDIRIIKLSELIKKKKSS